MRLQQYIAHCGVASRRKAEELIKQGLIKVNGKVITEPWFEVDEKKDWVRHNDKVIKIEKKIYIVLNKPAGFVTTVSDEKGRPTVIDLLKPSIKERVYPVGRLDFNTTGCLIITNDGDWANRIIHPKFEIPKKYMAKIKGRTDNYILNKLKKGIRIEDKFVKAKEARVVTSNKKNDVVLLVITEGINHQVKKMLSAVGVSPVWLKRVSVGGINTGGMAFGQWRHLSQDEVDSFNTSPKSKVQGPKFETKGQRHGEYKKIQNPDR
jgi:23S rRNA pseudouridine2605 synthase